MIYCWIKNWFVKISDFIDKQINYEFTQAKKDLLSVNYSKLNVSKRYLRYSRPEYFFLLELVLLLFFAFAAYHWFSLYSFIFNYSPNFIENNWDIADIPFDEVERIEAVRKSWLDWYEYFYTNGMETAKAQAYNFMFLGNLLRPIIMDTIQYIIIPMSIGYIVWFTIKYYEYVIAAVWGYFIMMYSFVTKKIECTLAKKWYIQFVTGWKKCSPSFGKYLSDWFNRFILRPLRQEQLNYMRAFDELKTWRKRTSSLTIIWEGIKEAISNIWKMILNAIKKLYMMIYNFFKSLGDLFLTVYNYFISIFGFGYKSETNTGETCECESEPVFDFPFNGENNNSQDEKQNTKNKNNQKSKSENDITGKCKDSIFIDLLIIFLLLLPIYKYIPLEKIMSPVRDFVKNLAEKSNISPKVINGFIILVMVIMLYYIDQNFYF